MHFKEGSRFKETIAAFYTLNGQDPHMVEVVGRSIPKELHDALAMTRWVEMLYLEVSEAVHLAARCQHICRWEVPRSSYPEGRVSYLKWEDDKIIRILKKAWGKMNERAQEAALNLPMSDHARSLVEQALS